MECTYFVLVYKLVMVIKYKKSIKFPLIINKALKYFFFFAMVCWFNEVETHYQFIPSFVFKPKSCMYIPVH